MKRKMNQPVGSTTVRADGIRYIKVAVDGPQKLRWMQYARFLWEAVNGAVPAGKRVLHKDGDATNDDIRNLMLGTAADVLWLHYHKDPKKSAANYRKCHGPTCLELVSLGLMSDTGPVEWCGGMNLFRVTAEGKEQMRLQSPQPPPEKKLTPGERRYLDYIRADCGLSFREWMGFKNVRRKKVT